MTDNGMETQELVLDDDLTFKRDPMESPVFQEPDLGQSGSGGGLPLGFWIGIITAVVVAVIGIWLIISSRSTGQNDQTELAQRIERLESRVEILAATVEETSVKVRNAGDITPVAERLDRFQSEIGVKVDLLASSVGTLQKQVKESAAKRQSPAARIKTRKTTKKTPVKKSAVQAKISRHTVKKGETLYSIGRTYNVSAAQIRKWNALPTSAIRIGQTLIVTQPR